MSVYPHGRSPVPTCTKYRIQAFYPDTNRPAGGPCLGRCLVVHGIAVAAQLLRIPPPAPQQSYLLPYSSTDCPRSDRYLHWCEKRSIFHLKRTSWIFLTEFLAKPHHVNLSTGHKHRFSAQQSAHCLPQETVSDPKASSPHRYIRSQITLFSTFLSTSAVSNDAKKHHEMSTIRLSSPKPMWSIQRH